MRPDVATDPNRTEWLAHQLFELGDGHSVRVIEALAAAFANRTGEPASGPDGGCGLAEAADPFHHDMSPDDGRLEVCRRIARRALHGSLTDPTCGANMFHRIDEEPPWARDHLPVSVVGPFLFYRT